MYCLQEPYYFGSRFPGLSHGYSCFGTPKSRAIIIAPSFMNFAICHEFSCPDFTVILSQNNDPEKKVFYGSFYLDNTKDVISQQMINFFQFLYNSNSKAIICLDSNAHSELWGSPIPNNRGYLLEDFCSQYNITVVNVGSKPTFFVSETTNGISEFKK